MPLTKFYESLLNDDYKCWHCIERRIQNSVKHPLTIFAKISILDMDIILNTPILLEMVSSQPAFTCSKLTIKTLEQGSKYVKS